MTTAPKTPEPKKFWKTVLRPIQPRYGPQFTDLFLCVQYQQTHTPSSFFSSTDPCKSWYSWGYQGAFYISSTTRQTLNSQDQNDITITWDENVTSFIRHTTHLQPRKFAKAAWEVTRANNNNVHYKCLPQLRKLDFVAMGILGSISRIKYRNQHFIVITN